MNPHTRQIIVVSALLLVLIALFIFFVVRPSIIGYRTYQTVQKLNYSLEDYGQNIDDLQSQVSVFDAKLTTCTDFNERIRQDLESCNTGRNSCTKDLEVLRLNMSFTNERQELLVADLSAEISKLNTSTANATQEKDATITQLQANYDILARKSANNICCKLKVDNPNIKYYAVGNNSVQCLEEGELAITC